MRARVLDAETCPRLDSPTVESPCTGRCQYTWDRKNARKPSARVLYDLLKWRNQRVDFSALVEMSALVKAANSSLFQPMSCIQGINAALLLIRPVG